MAHVVYGRERWIDMGASRLIALAAGLIILSGAASPQHTQSSQKTTIRVAAAISLRETLQTLVNEYRLKTGREVELTFGASGQVLVQIRNGAPIDVFISAATEQMDALESDGLLVTKTRRVVACNRLALIVPVESNAKLSGFGDLAKPEVRRLAIGEPATVPAGQYARQVLASLKLEASLADRLVFGTNVRQVLDYVARGEVTAGIVYATDARTSQEVQVVALADSAWHSPIEYPAAVLKQSTSADAAAEFLEFLTCDVAVATFQKNGFVSARSGGTAAATSRTAHSAQPASAPPGARSP